MPQLIVFYILIGIVCGVFILGMFYPKDNKILNGASIILSIVVATFIAFISFSSVPSNYFLSKVIYILLMILPFVPIFLFFAKIIKYPVLKLILVCILILNFAVSFLDIFNNINKNAPKNKIENTLKNF